MAAQASAFELRRSLVLLEIDQAMGSARLWASHLRSALLAGATRACGPRGWTIAGVFWCKAGICVGWTKTSHWNRNGRAGLPGPPFDSQAGEFFYLFALRSRTFAGIECSRAVQPASDLQPSRSPPTRDIRFQVRKWSLLCVCGHLTNARTAQSVPSGRTQLCSTSESSGSPVRPGLSRD